MPAHDGHYMPGRKGLSLLQKQRTIMKIHHLAMGARDLSRVASFYQEFFDLEEVTRHEDDEGRLRSIWLRLGEGVLMIEKTTDHPRHVEGIGAGLFLIAFSLTPEARGALEDRLIAAGHDIVARTPYTSYTHDPEGNRVAMSHYPV